MMNEMSATQADAPWWNRHPRCGFRFSPRDGVVLIVGAALTAGLMLLVGDIALLLAVLVFHFLLFCNVFRVGTKPELFWAASFAINVVCWVLTGMIEWWRIGLSQIPMTLIVLVWVMCQSDYHGVLAARLNPGHCDCEGSQEHGNES